MTSSTTVLAAPDFSMTRTLRGFDGFEDYYQNTGASKFIWLSDQKSGRDPEALKAFMSLRQEYTRQGKTFSPELTANATGIDPFLMAGIPTPIGAQVMLWLPFTANPVSGSLEYVSGWRLRSVSHYNLTRNPYHFSEDGDGRTDDGSLVVQQMGLGLTPIFTGVAQTRRFIPAAWQTVRFAPTFPGVGEIATERLKQEAFMDPVPLNIVDVGDMGYLPGIVADSKVRPTVMQGFVPNVGYVPTFHPLVIRALGDEMIIGVRPQNTAEAQYDFNDDEIEISYLFGRNGYDANADDQFGTPLVPNTQLGVYVSTGAAP